MAEFLTTSGTSFYIEKIILGAKKKLFLVSPFLQLSKTFYERIKDADNKGVRIYIIYGKDELKPNEKNSLADLKNLELHYFENLHAKCYFNESEMVITSMNMFEFSEKNNREMGVHILRSKDKALFEAAINESKSILDSSESIPLHKTERSYHKIGTLIKTRNSKDIKKEPNRGYCIRCQERIPFAYDRPLCYDCFSTWIMFENYDYIENVCHLCGEFESTSMAKPLCSDCFDEMKSIIF